MQRRKWKNIGFLVAQQRTVLRKRSRFFPSFLVLLLLTITGCEIPGSQNGGPIPIITLAPQAELSAEGAAGQITIDPADVRAVPDFITPTLLVPTPTATADRPTPIPYPDNSPTPDPPHYTEEEYSRKAHIIRPGETLSILEERYGVPLDTLLEINRLEPDTILSAGQTIFFPSLLDGVSPSFKIIPDSELIYGPTVGEFRTADFMQRYYPESKLVAYTEVVEGRPLNGIAIVDLVAIRYSLNPRLLLAVIEFRSGWVTRSISNPEIETYPLGHVQNGYEGLYTQLSWAANRINLGYYGRLEGGIKSFAFEDGTIIAFDPSLNHGTVGIQNWLASHAGATRPIWELEISPNGFFAAYDRLFGNPFGLTDDRPILPAGLEQPYLELPWERGVPWYYTSGPHGGWAAGSAWAALDFAPDKDQVGCYLSPSWVTAPAAGLVIYSDMGGVLFDLDRDGDPGTGWVISIWHIDFRERIEAGTRVRAGDRIGHASCEGGFSNGTHIHIARRYNGQWISADGPIPFNLEGWVSQGTGNEYDGYLLRGEQRLEACVCAEEDINEIVK